MKRAYSQTVDAAEEEGAVQRCRRATVEEGDVAAGPTSVAKLFLAAPPDPHTNFAAVWPPPAPGAKDTVPYAAVADALADISAESSRLECTRRLTNLFLAVLQRSPSELIPVIYLVMNKQGPAHEGVELGVGDALLMKAVAECCGISEARIKDEYRATGDLAEVAQTRKRKQFTITQSKPLSAAAVFKAMRDIALMSGKDAARRRSDMIKRLIRDAVGPEVNFIVRALQQKMRVGLAESSTLAAIGYAFALNHIGLMELKNYTLEGLQQVLNVGAVNVARIYNEVPSVEIVVGALLEYGFNVIVPSSPEAKLNADKLSIRPSIPVKPQLAHPTSGISVILKRLQCRAFTSEYKYDGERAQIHYSKEKGFQIFSRNSETHTGKYPDVIAMLPNTFSAQAVDSFIIDSEVVAVEEKTGALQSFQVLQHRSRKNVSSDKITIPVCVFAFDILYFNGVQQMAKPLAERRQILYTYFTPIQTKFQFAEHMDSTNVEDIQHFLDTSIKDGCEGLMVKTLEEEATYTPAKRSHYWLKLKKDYMDGLTDTFDLVPIGAFYGKGKRTGVFGGFLLACYNGENDEFQSICKIGTGFQDDELESITQSLQAYVLESQPRYYIVKEAPDIWLEASQVWEIKAADLSISPMYVAAYGLVEPLKGIALRFPRFVRIRDDKKPCESTCSSQIARMYKAQYLAQGNFDEVDTNE